MTQTPSNKAKEAWTAFFKDYPGPFDYAPDTNGVDRTFDVFGLKTGEYVTSASYCDEREWAEITAATLAAALNLLRQQV